MINFFLSRSHVSMMGACIVLLTSRVQHLPWVEPVPFGRPEPVPFGCPHVMVEPGHLGYSGHLVAGDWFLNSVVLSREVEQPPVDRLNHRPPLIFSGLLEILLNSMTCLKYSIRSWKEHSFRFK
jgi:hypothetical protein